MLVIFSRGGLYSHHNLIFIVLDNYKVPGFILQNNLLLLYWQHVYNM